MEIIEMLEDYTEYVMVEGMSVYAAREVTEELSLILGVLETLGYKVFYA
jgi:hypothetical protein